MILEKIKQKILSLGITGKELKLLLFLLIIFFAGLLIKSVKRIYPEHEKFDYSSIDSMFSKTEYIPDSSDREFKGKNDSLIVEELTKRNKHEGKASMLMNKKIDINKATIAELKMLPGVGEKTAEAILAYRIKVMKFDSIEELMKIKGIGSKKFEKVKDYIVVSEN